MLKKAVFLDRDGVLNQDLGYVHKIRDIKWIDGAIDTIKLFNKLNYLVFVVTNQSGVARNYYSENDVIKLHLWMKDFLKKMEQSSINSLIVLIIHYQKLKNIEKIVFVENQIQE